MWPYNPVAHGWPCHGHLMKTRYLTSPITSAKNYCFPALHGLVLHSHVLEASYSSDGTRNRAFFDNLVMNRTSK